MKVLALVRYGRRGASTRLRTLQYLPYLNANGCEVVVSPLFTDEYLAALYAGRPRWKFALVGFARRLSVLATSGRYDALWVEKELFPFAPAIFERLLSWLNIRLIVDYDDALFHRYDCHRNIGIRALLGRKIDAVMKSADVVLAGNEYLAARARQAGAARVEILPTVIDTSRYKRVERYSQPPVIGWIGSPSTSRYLYQLSKPLQRIQEETGAVVRLIGSGSVDLPGVDVEVLEWSEEEEARQVAEFDVGIMPLPDSPWERGKCGYKLIQYMGCGVPVVASPVGVNSVIVQPGVNGYLATSDEEWYSALSTLINDASRRAQFGTAAEERVKRFYSTDYAAPRLLEILKRVCN